MCPPKKHLKTSAILSQSKLAARVTLALVVVEIKRLICNPDYCSGLATQLTGFLGKQEIFPVVYRTINYCRNFLFQSRFKGGKKI